jgi:PAS domain S-box-containing protein
MIIDLKTVMFVSTLVNIICAGAIAIIWYQNRKHFAGLAFWLVDMILLTTGTTLVILRDLVPDFFSIVLANTMIVGGIVIIYMGLERFVGKKSSQIHNYVLLAIFVGVHAYYTHVEPILLIRSLNFSAATMIFTFQCCWLLLRRVGPSMRRITGIVSIVFGCYVATSVARIILLTLFPPQSSDFFKTGTADTLAMTVYIMLTAALALSLILMVNRRLLGEVQITTEDLKVKSDLLNQTSSLAKVGGWEFDVKTLEQTWTEEVYRIHEVELDYQPTVERGIRFYAPEAIPIISQAVQRAIDHGEPFDLELPFITAKGNHLWVHAIGRAYRQDGKIVKVGGTFQDITNRKQAEEALRASEEKYRELVENLNDIVFSVDISGVITYMSPVLESLSKYQAGEVIGQNFIRFIHPDDLPGLLASFESVLAGQLQPREYRLIDKDGTARWVRSSSRPQIEAGQVVGITGILTDITEHKTMLQRLVLTDRLSALGDMAGGFAHELNNPLSGVLGYAQLLQDRKDLPADIRKDIELIYKEGRRAADIIKNFMVFAGKQPAQKQLADVNSLIQDILNLRQYEQTKSNIVVKTKFGKLPPVEVDHSQMRQVFLNIVTNADYFMLKAHKKGTLTITTKKKGNMVLASFADDGPGIPAEQLSHIFDPFFTTNEAGQGTGLGLSICHGIVTEHGGRMHVESEVGKGTTFVVELPALK